MAKRERQFEILRTVAMLFIIVYHCLTHGVGSDYVFHIDQSASLSNILYSDFLLVFSSISVNLYVMISGYFLSDLDFKMSRIIRTWVQVCFYSVMITVIMMIMGRIPLSIVTIGKSLFPLSTDTYWFVTQFIGLLILSPFLTMLARKMSYQQYICLLTGGAILCLAIIPDFPLGKRFHVAHGNSVWSFAYLYMIAGFIKHHIQTVPNMKLLWSIFFMTLITMGYEFIYGYHHGSVNLYWFDYNSLPFILSILVFLLFRQLHIADSSNWIILAKIAPYSFGVYLIHDHLLVRGWLWNSLPITTLCDKWMYPFVVLGLCIMIYLACAFIDATRKKFFTIIGIDKLIARTDRWSCIFK